MRPRRAEVAAMLGQPEPAAKSPRANLCVNLVTQPLAIEATDPGPAAIVPGLPRAP
jgi:hypothetical protein